MKRNIQVQLLILNGLLLLFSGATSAAAQDTYVEGRIRWSKEMGVVPNGQGNDYPVTDPCSIFNVAALDANTQKPVTYTDQVKAPFRRRDEPGFYVCYYSLKVPQGSGLYIMPTMGGLNLLPQETRDPYLITGAWIGGSRSKPPVGYERGFTGHKYITPRSNNPKKRTVWIVNFQLTYLSSGPN